MAPVRRSLVVKIDSGSDSNFDSGFDLDEEFG